MGPILFRMYIYVTGISQCTRSSNLCLLAGFDYNLMRTKGGEGGGGHIEVRIHTFILGSEAYVYLLGG